MSSSKRLRSPSPSPATGSNLFPLRSMKRPKPAPEFAQFTNDLEHSLRRMLPTGGRRYERAAIIAIQFSKSDLKVDALRDELLDYLSATYNWAVEKFVIDCNKHWMNAEGELRTAILTFAQRYGSRGAEKTLLTYYFSGHAFHYGRDHKLFLYGSNLSNCQAARPWINWDNTVHATFGAPYPQNTSRLGILDCCYGGLASVGRDMEILAASSWDSIAPADAHVSFTRALIDSLKSFKGDSVTTTNLISHMHNQVVSAKRGNSQPLHKASADRSHPPVLFHRIEHTPTPPANAITVPRHAHVEIHVEVEKEDTIPSKEAFEKWLSTEMPPYIGEIAILAWWKTSSGTVAIVLPIAIWLDLPDRPAYSFIRYFPQWDAERHRQEIAPLLVKPLTESGPSQTGESRLPGPKKENIPPRPSAGGSGGSSKGYRFL